MPELTALGKYSFTVLFGLAIHGIIVLPLILKIIGRRSPGKFVRGMGPALLSAFSTASSSATLPITMQGVEEENGISNRTASFVLPLGATINMDGTALYESVAAIFIAQVYGIPLSPVMQAVIFLTATLAAVGAAGIPQAGLVTMIIVLRAVNLPIEGIGLLLAIDWLLDRFRTTVNVWGDSVGAGVIETLESKAGRASS
jgi:solute carrier family 1 (high affinity glutamate transporter) protein 1